MQKNIDILEMRSQMWGSFLLFCETFFPLVTGRPFVISTPTGRESHFITISRELMKCARLETDSLLINCPPGSGKSVMMSMFVAWTMSRWPDSQFLYVSFSSILSAKHTAFIKRILECSAYQQLFDVRIRPDSKAKDFFTTNHGGVVKAFGSASSITGNDGGLPNLDRFSGAVICFPYGEVVHTEFGPMQIGEIVDQKLDVKVWSMNLHTREIELQPIQDWYENPGSEIVEIGLSDGSSVHCTPNHRIWTDNRGWVEAKDLLGFDKLVSPRPKCRSGYGKLVAMYSVYDRSIKNSVNLCARKLIELRRFNPLRLNRKIGGRFFSALPARSYVINGSLRYPVFFSNVARKQRAHNNINKILGAKFAMPVLLTHAQSSVNSGIVHIFRARTIPKITQSIVELVSITMTYLMPFRSIPNKSLRNQMMHISRGMHVVTRKNHRNVILSVATRSARAFKNYSLKRFLLPILAYKTPRHASSSSHIGNLVEPFIPSNIAPLFVKHVGHVDKTYCINVKNNHTFFAGLNQSILTANCDDLTKPDDSHSSTIRESIQRNYKETILQRLRGPNVPIICIAQRLHEDDICAYMTSGKDERKYKSVVLKAIDDAGNALYPEVNPLSQLLDKKEKSPYVFASQYQQDPIPAGGALFKREHFALLDEEPAMLCTFITADTAETAHSWNDATALSFWGLYYLEDGQTLSLHWIDAQEIRVEPKDLQEAFLSFYADCMRYPTKPQFAAIEKKSTGVTLLSVLGELRGLQLREVKRTSASGSKTTRFLEMQPIIASKLISFTRNAFHVELCIKHLMKITANDSHKSDDLTDSLYDAVKIALIDKTLYIPDSANMSKKTILKNMQQDQQSRQRAFDAARTRR